MSAASRAAVLDSLRSSAAMTVARPSRGLRPAPPSDLVSSLRESLELAGGRLVRVDESSASALHGVVPDLETASHVWSGLSSVEPRGAAVGAQYPGDLAALEFTLLDGQVAVAENGAVWNVPSDPLERSAALLAEHLVLVVPQHGVVADLHDAYARLEPSATAFGWFLAGPSKTADIEQALVHGAHGPRQLTLVVSAC